MSNIDTEELTMEDRLKAVVYQFIALYERWSEDRQLAAKQGSDTAALIKIFIEQVKNFKELEPKVRQHLAESIQTATSRAAEKIGEGIGKEAVRATEEIARQLAQASEKAECTLMRYENEMKNTQWKIIGSTIFTAIATSLLIVWLLMSTPTLPLTKAQLGDLRSGQLMHEVWPKLSKKEQQHWVTLADQVTHV